MIVLVTLLIRKFEWLVKIRKEWRIKITAKLPIQRLPLSSVLFIFKTYILPIFYYGLPIYATKMSMSAEKKIDSVFSKFMKRYLRLPHFCNNDVIHFFTRTEPLSVTLKKKARHQFYSITFPSGLSGFRPTMFQDLPAPSTTLLGSSFQVLDLSHPYLCFPQPHSTEGTKC